VAILPEWMQWLAIVSPATYALRGIRAAVLDGGLGAAWSDLWPLLVLRAAAIPVGLAVFRAGERYAKAPRQAQTLRLSTPQHRRLARQSSGVEAGDELARLDRLPPRASPTIAATQPHEALPTSSKSRVSGARTGCDGAC
jgi:hypothetical protein